MICPRKSTALRRARRHGCSARRHEAAPPPPCRRTTTTSRNTSRRRCIPCIATRPSSRRRTSASRTITSSRNMPTPSRSRTRRVTTMRSTAGSNPASTTISAIRPIRTILTPIRTSYEEEPAPKKRSSGLMTVAAVLALAVVGTGAAFAYRTYVGSPRSGEPPIIRADNSPTKVVPAQSDAGASKTPDRMPSGDGGEKLVSREETPVDVNSRSGGPRVVFPPLNQNGNPPPVASVSPSAPTLRRPPTARCRTTSRAGSRRSRSRATRPTMAASPQAPRRRRQTGTGDAVRRRPRLPPQPSRRCPGRA